MLLLRGNFRCLKLYFTLAVTNIRRIVPILTPVSVVIVTRARVVLCVHIVKWEPTASVVVRQPGACIWIMGKKKEKLRLSNYKY